MVGYRVTLDSQIFTDGVAVKKEGSEVASNTKFAFGVIVEDSEGPAKTFPPTKVEFLVLDPSGVVLDTQEQDLNTEIVKVEPFDFTIPEPNIPGGYLSFTVRLTTEGVEGVHSERTARYFYPNNLQASSIEFAEVLADEQPSFKVGDRVSMSFVPVIVDSNGESVPLAKEINDQMIGCARKFVLQLATSSGDVFQSVESKCESLTSDRCVVHFSSCCRRRLCLFCAHHGFSVPLATSSSLMCSQLSSL